MVMTLAFFFSFVSTGYALEDDPAAVSGEATEEEQTVPDPGTEDENGDDEDPLPAADSFIFSEHIRSGEEFTVQFMLNCDPCFAVNGIITYDPSILSFTGFESVYDNWSVSGQGTEGKIRFLAIDPMLVREYGSGSLFSMRFRLGEDLPEHTEIALTASSLCLSDGEKDVYPDGFSGMAFSDRDLRNDPRITSLDIGFGTNPAFSPDIYSYLINVPYETESLDIKYTADEFSRIEIDGNEFKVGENTLRIKITSETGESTGEYVFTVVRNLPADYVFSSDARLSDVLLSEGILEPAFSPDISEYKLTVDRDSSFIRIVPSTVHPLAHAEEITFDLSSGSEIKITCFAEDKSALTYVFKVERFSKDTRAVSESGTATTADPNTGNGKTQETKKSAFGYNLIIGAVIIIAVTFFAALTVIISGRKQSSHKKENDADKKQEAGSTVCNGGNTEEPKTGVPGEETVANRTDTDDKTTLSDGEITEKDNAGKKKDNKNKKNKKKK